MAKTNIDGEIKLSYTEILFAPVLTLLAMVKTKNEASNDDKKLNPNSIDKVEVELAKNLDEIENQVNKKYGKLDNARLSKKQWKVKDIDSTKTVSSKIKNEHIEENEHKEGKTR